MKVKKFCTVCCSVFGDNRRKYCDRCKSILHKATSARSTFGSFGKGAWNEFPTLMFKELKD